MSAFFLLPCILSLFLVIRGKVETAFLSIYLPALLLLPQGYAVRFPHFPPFSAAQGALIPIGVVALYRLVRSGAPRFLDILIILFMISTSTTEILHEQITNDGIFLSVDTFLSIFIAYVVGRTIIEPGLRLATVKRIVILVLLLGPLGLVEWRFGQNVYGVVGHNLFQTIGVHSGVQYRAGRGRMSLSFNDAELAGIAIGMTLALNSWLFYISKNKVSGGLGRLQDRAERLHLPGIVLLLYLLATQSRGPLIAVAAAWTLLQLSRFKHRRIALFLVAILLASGAYWGYIHFLKYTNVSTSAEIADEMQGSAVYRRQMNELYQPIVKKGGWLGWSMLSHPIIPGMASVDNEYLLVQIAYGTIGYIIFLFIAIETSRRLIAQLWKRQVERDHVFVVSMLGAMAVFWIAIYTVYMGEQLPQFAFLLIGWSQSFKPELLASKLDSSDISQSRFAFKRVYQ
jgi:hypothetical protein